MLARPPRGRSTTRALLAARLLGVPLVASPATAQRPAEPTAAARVTPIAAAYAHVGRGDTVTIAGRVTLGSGVLQPRLLDANVADATGGLRVFSRARTPWLVEGDSVVVSGVLQRYRGSAELLATAVTRVPAPRRLVPPRQLARPEALPGAEGSLVSVHALVRAAGWSEGGRWFRLGALAADDSPLPGAGPADAPGALPGAPGTGGELTLWLPASHRDQDAFDGFGVGDRVAITGVVWAYQDNPADEVVWQVIPREAADVRVIGIPQAWWALGRRGAVVLLIGGLAATLVARAVTRRSARALRETEARYAQLLALSPAPVLVHDGRAILFANAAAAALLGAPGAAALAGRPVADFAPVDAPTALLVVHAAADGLPGDAATVRTRVCAAEGRTVPVEVTKSACRYNDRPAAVVLLRDLSEELEREAALRALADVDELTGVANRRGFLVRAATALDAAWKSGRRATLVFADVDGLKQINDAHGHAAGDAAIRAVAAALSEVVSAGDVVARLSGDEFVALTIAPERSPEGGASGDGAGSAVGTAAVRASLVADFDDALAAAAALAGAPFEVSASVGLCAVDDEGRSPAAALTAAIARADADLYREKGVRSGRVFGAGRPAGS